MYSVEGKKIGPGKEVEIGVDLKLWEEVAKDLSSELARLEGERNHQASRTVPSSVGQWQAPMSRLDKFPSGSLMLSVIKPWHRGYSARAL